VFATLQFKASRLLNDVTVRRILQNSSLILGANGIASLLNFITAALAARGLGVEAFGMLALVTAYHATVSSIVSFQAWQAIIKYGNDALKDMQQDTLKQLYKFGFLLDSTSALLGFMIALLGIGPTVRWLGWDHSLSPLLFVYAFLLLFNISGTPIGILRLYQRFDLLSRITVLDAVVKFVGVGLCLLTNQDIVGFVVAYLVTGIIGNILRVVTVLHVLRQQQLLSFLSAPIRVTSFPGIWEFVWTTNLHSTIKLLSREVDIFIVAAFTSPAMVGYYKIAKQFSRIFITFLDPLGQTLYPELAKLWAHNDKAQFRRLVRLSGLSAGIGALLLWLGLLIVGRWLIPFLFGSEYAPAYAATIAYCFAWTFGFWGFAYTHSAMAQGQPRIPLWGNIVATVVYIAVLPFLVQTWDIIGAGVAFTIYYIVWIIFMRVAMKDRNLTSNP
jgi:O-antigen/teichoic acid export membrane protein